MSEHTLSDVTCALNLAVFQRKETGRFQMLGRAPDWVSVIWPRLSHSEEVSMRELGPFVGSFLVDATRCWQSAGANERISSGHWVESDGNGRELHLQATALRAGNHAVLLIEETGQGDPLRTSIQPTAYSIALTHDHPEQTMAKQQRSPEPRSPGQTASLPRSNGALAEDIAIRHCCAERLHSIRKIDHAILASRSPEAIADAALRQLYPLLPCQYASLVVLDPDSGRASILACVHEGHTTSREGWQLSQEQLQEVQVLQSGQPHRIVAAPNHFGPVRKHEDADETIWPLIVDIPLIAEDTLVGVLNLATRSPEKFTRDHEEIAETVAAQLAVAISHARLFVQISTGREQLRALSLRLVEVQEAERRFMAHELHDEIGQLLTGLKLTLELPREEAGNMQPNSGEAIALVGELMQRVRQLSLDLRPQILDDLGLLPALDWLFKRYQKQTGVAIRFRHSSINGRFPTLLETAAFRIVQEALTNIARHACVHEATVRVWMNEQNLGVQIEDQGVGFDPEQALAKRSSSGVTGMRERAVMLGGDFTLESKPGGGTRLTVEMPLLGATVAANYGNAGL